VSVIDDVAFVVIIHKWMVADGIVERERNGDQDETNDNRPLVWEGKK
jgi:hypothetical protein